MVEARASSALHRVSRLLRIRSIPKTGCIESFMGSGTLYEFILLLSFPSKYKTNDSAGETRIAWIGIVATVFLNIIACEFGYINGEALDVASSKIWKTSLDSVDSLPPPALALVQDSFFKDRGVLVSDSAELNTLYELHKNATEITNQRSFNNFTSRMSPSTDTPTNFVFFDGNYKQLKHGDDLDLYYEYYGK